MRTALLSHDMEGRRPDSPPAAAGVIMMMMLEVYGKRPSDKARDLRGYDSAVKAARGKRVHDRAPQAPAADWHKTPVFNLKLPLRL